MSDHPSLSDLDSALPFVDRHIGLRPSDVDTMLERLGFSSLAELMDGAKRYQQACMEIVHRRAQAMIEGLGIAANPGPLYDAYYGLIDFEFWAKRNLGEEAVQYLKKNIHPLDLAFRLAEMQMEVESMRWMIWKASA